MGSTAPWWGTSVIAFVGSAFGVIITSLLTILTARTQRRRLFRDDKIVAYPHLARASRKLAGVSIWPSDPEYADQRLDDVLDLAEQAAFLGSARVNTTVETLLVAAKNHHAVIATIRHDSKPGYRGSIDVRLQSKFTASVADLRRAIDAFVRAGRHELEIGGAYHPIEGPTSQAEDGAL